jgi:hypothetical protein
MRPWESVPAPAGEPAQPGRGLPACCPRRADHPAQPGRGRRSGQRAGKGRQPAGCGCDEGGPRRRGRMRRSVRSCFVRTARPLGSRALGFVRIVLSRRPSGSFVLEHRSGSFGAPAAPAARPEARCVIRNSTPFPPIWLSCLSSSASPPRPCVGAGGLRVPDRAVYYGRARRRSRCP